MISVTDRSLPTPPPTWALSQRNLIATMRAAARLFQQRYTRADGSLVWRQEWPGMDGSDDGYESWQNWSLFAALGGGMELHERARFLWEAVTRQFTAYVGVPPYRYLIELRIERARQLLRETELTVTQICHRVGFNSLSHFTTTFRQHTGLSPSAYRRRRDWEQDAHRFSPITQPLVEQPNKRLST